MSPIDRECTSLYPCSV